MRGRLFGLCIIVSCILIYISVFSGTYIHEVLHARTQMNHGCLNNSIEINPVSLHGKSICYEYLPRTQEDIYYEQLQHSMNDAVGYNVQTIELLLGFILICLILITFKVIE